MLYVESAAYTATVPIPGSVNRSDSGTRFIASMETIAPPAFPSGIKIKKGNFDREEVLLPAEEKEKRKSEIDKLEKETIELQTQHFGSNGDYFQKRQELVKPIQDRIFTAMKKIAKRDSYSFVFDKANQSNLIYADKEADISNTVLEEMGITKE